MINLTFVAFGNHRVFADSLERGIHDETLRARAILLREGIEAGLGTKPCKCARPSCLLTIPLDERPAWIVKECCSQLVRKSAEVLESLGVKTGGPAF